MPFGSTIGVATRRGVLAAAILASAAACGGDSTSPKPSIRNYFSQVTSQSGDVSATYNAGAAPAAGSGPTATIEALSAPILGGPAQVRVVGSADFSHVIITVDGVPGYYDLSVPANDTAVVLLYLNQTLPHSNFTVNYGVGASAASIGTYSAQDVSVTTVGTGDVQVSLSWDAASDVDLHVVDPNGDEIYYGNQELPSGASLDIDSNADCAIDGKQVENVTYPSGKAPHGTYTVRVDYYKSCGVAASHYAVTVHVKGKSPQSFTGTLTGTGDLGDVGSGETVTTFTY